MRRRHLLASALGAGVLGVAGCGSEPGSGDGDGDAAAPRARTFVHPGLLHTERDFERMRTKVAARAEPWLGGWNALAANGRSQLGASPRPLQTVVRGGDGQNFAQLYIDTARAYQLALRWKVSGDTRYADLCVSFLNAWSSTLTGITGNADRFLAAGIYGVQFANAAEILRSYPGWAAADLARFQDMMLKVFYPLSSDFLVRHNGAVITNYWANWDQCALACVLSIGVLCDRADIYDEAMAYYRNGAGNGAALQAVCHVHPGYLGQWQESGRDQGHATLGIGLGGMFCEMAWNQGDDVYRFDNHRFLAGAEYVAKSNLADAAGAFPVMPYQEYSNKQGVSTGVSPAAQGIRRPVWESVLHHYEGRLGVGAPWVRRQAEQLRPEFDGGNGDQLGFGTLTFAREPRTGGSPSGLTARLHGGAPRLSWWGVPGALQYRVKRADRAGGPYTTIATVADLLTWTDTPPAGATWLYYVVTALDAAGGESAASGEVSVSVTPHLVLHLPFDEGGGRVLDGLKDFVSLPPGIVETLGDCTLAARVRLDAAQAWARIFDIGSGPRRSMFLTPRNAAGVVRFSIDTVHGYGAQVIDGNAALPAGAWAHVAVTLSGATGTLYVNGVPVGTNAAMTLAPADLGAGMDGWIGRSQYAGDPYLKGAVRDVRIHAGALDARAIAALAAG